MMGDRSATITGVDQNLSATEKKVAERKLQEQSRVEEEERRTDEGKSGSYAQEDFSEDSD